MDWRRAPGTNPADPHGVADLLARACDEVATSAVEGTRFLFSTAEMLHVSREVEQAALVDPAHPLYVGVQRGHRLDAQSDVYRMLTAVGVPVLAFGVDEGTAVPGVYWTTVPDDSNALAASWFVVRGGDDPHALVGFELTGSHGLRRWEGFETRDRLLVEAIVGHLDDLAGNPMSHAGGQPADPSVDVDGRSGR